VTRKPAISTMSYKILLLLALIGPILLIGAGSIIHDWRRRGKRSQAAEPQSPAPTNTIPPKGSSS
jgi:hypothetical protein